MLTKEAATLPLRLYTDPDLVTRVGRAGVVSIVRAALAARDDAVGALDKFGRRATNFAIVDSRDDADAFILPVSWNRLRPADRVAADALARDAARQGLPIVIWGEGDHELVVPYRNAILVQSGLHASRRRVHRGALERPSIFGDLVETYFDGVLPTLPKEPRARIGFCGYASTRLRVVAMERLRWTGARVLDVAGRSRVVPPRPGSVGLRARMLETFRRSSEVDTDFIVRNRYRAGVRGDAISDPAHALRMEFIRNLVDSPYTLCVRGTGNFSKRLYEALCCGRIPVLLDTDSVLPFEDDLAWDAVCVRVPEADREQAPTILARWHAAQHPDHFQTLQHRARQLWLRHLSSDGYFTTLATQLAMRLRKGDPRRLDE